MSAPGDAKTRLAPAAVTAEEVLASPQYEALLGVLQSLHQKQRFGDNWEKISHHSLQRSLQVTLELLAADPALVDGSVCRRWRLDFALPYISALVQSEPAVFFAAQTRWTAISSA